MHGSIFFTFTSHCSFQFFGCIMRFTQFTFSSGYMSFMRITNCFIGFKSSCLVPGVSASFSCVLTRLTIESFTKATGTKSFSCLSGRVDFFCSRSLRVVLNATIRYRRYSNSSFRSPIFLFDFCAGIL